MSLRFIQNLLVQMQLVHGIDQVVLLVTHVHALEYRQHLTFSDPVAGTNLALLGDERAFVAHFLNFHTFRGRRARGEAGADAVEPGGVEHRRAGQHQRPRFGRLLGDGDEIAFGSADAQGFAGVFGHGEGVGLAGNELDGQVRCFARRRDGFFRAGSLPRGADTAHHHAETDQHD